MTSNAISEKELVRGWHLKRLASSLMARAEDLRSAFGLSSARWYKLEDAEVLLARSSLLTRLLTNHPNFNPFSISFAEVLAQLESIDRNFTPQKLAVLIGLGANDWERLMVNNSMTPTTAAFLRIIRHELRYRSRKEAKEFISILEKNALDEAEARWLPEEKMWKYGGWTRFATNPEIPKKTRNNKKA